MESSRGIYQDSEGISFADIALRHQDGLPLASVRVRTAGHTHTGVASFVVALRGRAGTGAFTRMGRGIVGSGSGGRTTVAEMKSGPGSYQRLPVTKSKETKSASQVNTHAITSRPTKSGFSKHKTATMYSHTNCRQTIQNCGSVDLVEYAQFFACYTETNREKSQFYWSSDKQFKSFESLGGRHLDAYIVAPGSTFERLGVIPHALRGGGKVADTWYQPALIGHPSPKGWRHIVFTEPAVTAGLASGMGGIAMDYIAYPGREIFERGEVFFDSHPAPYCQNA